MYGRKLLLAFTLLSLAGCSQTFSAGPAGTSVDGKTYFVVYDGPGKKCQAPTFDGEGWKGGYNTPLQVSVGPHRYECGGTVITLNMPKGMIYKVDYRLL
ncbi:hypothetical protein [Dyella sp. C9]|uniref:hypothetical protein n=1 Tax=Dyella sp. C9 TaxID=2202154 RepID=UPI00130018D2|nr:hypothetical protein [Dyella sp. C9]